MISRASDPFKWGAQCRNRSSQQPLNACDDAYAVLTRIQSNTRILVIVLCLARHTLHPVHFYSMYRGFFAHYIMDIIWDGSLTTCSRGWHTSIYICAACMRMNMLPQHSSVLHRKRLKSSSLIIGRWRWSRPFTATRRTHVVTCSLPALPLHITHLSGLYTN